MSNSDAYNKKLREALAQVDVARQRVDETREAAVSATNEHKEDIVARVHENEEEHTCQVQSWHQGRISQYQW